jgi:ubiquinone/menaquinone biosynthesis C-methylase UbiE
VACGTGVLTKALADTGLHVIGVDSSEGYLEGAQRRRSHPNITYEGGDVRQMRFEDNSFGAAVSTLALDVIPEIEQVVAEMKRVTRPGGIVASGVHQFFTFTSRQGRFANVFQALSDSVRDALEHHVRDGYLVGLPDGPRSFPMMFRVVRGVVPAQAT